MHRSAPMSKLKAGPAAYLLLRGEGNRRTQAGPARSASFLPAPVLHSSANTCSSASEFEDIDYELEVEAAED
jgi:hypothetical protein